MSDETNVAPASDEAANDVSRFSKAEAEAAGWVFVHDAPAELETTSSTQGEHRVTPPYIVAEKSVSFPGHDASLITETAETTGKLLERIALYEAHLARVGNPTVPVVQDLSGEPQEVVLNEDSEAGEPSFEPTGNPAGTILLPDGARATEAEFALASRNDVLIRRNEDGDLEQTFTGGLTPENLDASQSFERNQHDIEQARTAQPDPGPTVQISVDTSQSVDSPGQSAGGLILVREGETVDDAAQRLDDEAAQAESDRVEATQGGTEAPPEGVEELAGADSGLASRGDLESEIPDAGSVDTQPLERVTGEEPAPAPAESPALDSVNAASEAGEVAAKEARDEADTPEQADGAEAQQAVEDASSEAAQEAQDVQPSEEVPAEPATDNADAGDSEATNDGGSVEDALPEPPAGA